MFRRHTDGRNVSCVIRFNEADDKTDHYSAWRDGTVGNGLGCGQQVFKRFTTVSFAIYKTALVETPTLIKL